MKRFLIFFGGGVVVTYIGNFFYYSTYADSRGTGFFIANAFAEALPKLITVFWIIAAVVFLIWFATWWIGNNDQIKQQVGVVSPNPRNLQYDISESKKRI